MQPVTIMLILPCCVKDQRCHHRVQCTLGSQGIYPRIYGCHGNPNFSTAVLVEAVTASRHNWLRCIGYHRNLAVLVVAVNHI